MRRPDRPPHRATERIQSRRRIDLHSEQPSANRSCGRLVDTGHEWIPRRRENTLDCGDIYKALRGDFVGLLGSATTGQLETIIAAWAREAPAFEDGLRLLGYQIGNHFVGEPERRIVGNGGTVATVTAPAFEILRACAGRLSTAQIAGFSWTGDAARFLPHLSRYSFPDVDLHD